jgi:hypothetical protein
LFAEERPVPYEIGVHIAVNEAKLEKIVLIFPVVDIWMITLRIYEKSF